jgi:hypothetical protein
MSKTTYEAVGIVKVINDTQTFASGFEKREIVITTPDDKYPQDVKFEVVKDKCQVLDGFSIGQEVKVLFDVRGNEYNGKYYVNLAVWRIDALSQASNTAATTATPEPTPTPSAATVAPEEDDIPF